MVQNDVVKTEAVDTAMTTVGDVAGEAAKAGLTTGQKVGAGLGITLGVGLLGFGIYKLVKHFRGKKADKTVVVDAKTETTETK